jgi:hypothetical protein
MSHITDEAAWRKRALGECCGPYILSLDPSSGSPRHGTVVIDNVDFHGIEAAFGS